MQERRLQYGSHMESADVASASGSGQKRALAIVLGLVAAAVCIAAAGFVVPTHTELESIDFQSNPWAKAVLNSASNSAWLGTTDVSLKPLPAYNANDGYAERDELALPNEDDADVATMSSLMDLTKSPAKASSMKKAVSAHKATKTENQMDVGSTENKHENPDVKALQTVRDKVFAEDHPSRRANHAEQKNVFEKAAHELARLRGHVVRPQGVAVDEKARKHETPFEKRHPVLAALEKENEVKAAKKAQKEEATAEHEMKPAPAKARHESKPAEAKVAKVDGNALTQHKAEAAGKEVKKPGMAFKDMQANAERQVKAVLHKVTAHPEKRKVVLVNAAGDQIMPQSYKKGVVHMAEAALGVLERKERKDQAAMQREQAAIRIAKLHLKTVLAERAMEEKASHASVPKAGVENKMHDALEAEMAKLKSRDQARMAALKHKLDSLGADSTSKRVAGAAVHREHTPAKKAQVKVHSVDKKAESSSGFAAQATIKKAMSALIADEKEDNSALAVNHAAQGVDLTQVVRLR